MQKTFIKFNSVIVVLLIVCFVAGFVTGFIVAGASGKFSESRNFDHSGRDYEHSREMGRAAELLGAIDENFGGIQDGLGRIKLHLEQDTGDLRRIAQRLRDIAAEVSAAENYLLRVRSDIDYFRRRYDSGFSAELDDIQERRWNTP